MATFRMLPPGMGTHLIAKANGRTYTCALGSTIDVPDFDAGILMANGWVCTNVPAGATSARPVLPARNQLFLDTTLGYVVVFDDKLWRNPSTGASV